ncbi:MAG: hypothetical protein U0271_30030 [Polyangiaceae bacterium]
MGWIRLLVPGVVALTATGCSVDRVFAPPDSGGGGAGAQAGSNHGGTGPLGGAGGDGIGGSPLGGAGGSGGVGGAPPTCGAGRVCVPDPPAGFQGPVVLFEAPTGMTAPACSSDYPIAFGEFQGALDPGVATCDCSCTAAAGIQCTTPVNLCYKNNCMQACSQGLGDTVQSVAPGVSCTTAPASGAAAVNVNNPAPTNMGTCNAQSNHVIPTPTFGLVESVCGGGTATPDGCDANEQCLPDVDSDFTLFCVAQDGEKLCLDPFYSVQHLVAMDADDSRACSQCGCGSATSTCGGSVEFTSNNCMILEGSVNANMCGTNPSFASRVQYVPNPSGSCPATGGVLSGDVQLTGPLTLCCNG